MNVCGVIEGSVHASSKFKDEKHEEPMTLEQASAMLDNARGKQNFLDIAAYQ